MQMGELKFTDKPTVENLKKNFKVANNNLLKHDLEEIKKLRMEHKKKKGFQRSIWPTAKV